MTQTNISKLIDHLIDDDFFSDVEWMPLSKLLEEVNRKIVVDSEKMYNTIGVRWYCKGVFSHGDTTVKAKTLKKIQAGDLIYNKLFAWKGSFDIVREEFDGCYASNEFPTFVLKKNEYDVDLNFIKYYFRIPSSWSIAGQFSKGTAKISRNRLSVKDFLNIKIPIPRKQIRIKISSLLSAVEELDQLVQKSSNLSSSLYNGIVANVFENYHSDNVIETDE